ncbi:hypothetical protein RESH_01080 [Rhodopirellula europaea SH398]|uniref:Uncharacterized protein n=2 Tax=Rhodopirellula europaea TaxID=1263866 RepID=M2A619_9BACT|nr:hypothetical protein RE6C_03348 [Rhodopirellula europaea 6C]EMI28340.1 hypothetical protein RESH_01080 [Rhodopirellula europaea SH398]
MSCTKGLIWCQLEQPAKRSVDYGRNRFRSTKVFPNVVKKEIGYEQRI